MATAISPASPELEALRQRAATGAALPGVNPMDFVRDHRIHVKDGSLFLGPLLTIHPAELAPEQEAALRQKLAQTYQRNQPSFYEVYDRATANRFDVAFNLGQLVPVTLAAKHSKLMEEIGKYNTQVETGVDADLQKQTQDRLHPFAAIVRDTLTDPKKDPAGIDTLKSGMAMFLLLREALTRAGFRGALTSYVAHTQTADQVLQDLAPKLGITPLAVREAAVQGGLDGVGAALKLDPAYVAEVKQVVEQAAARDFSTHLVENWHLGQQLSPTATLEEKIAIGMEARITTQIAKLREQVKGQYATPPAIQAEEKRIAEALNLLEPVQRAVLHKMGYEIGYTPDGFADSIAFHRNVYGLHRRGSDNPREPGGIPHIYFAGHGDLKASMRTLVHEVAHNLWPAEFGAAESARIDALAASDAKRFAALNRIMDEKFPEFEKFLHAYQAGSDAEKAAIVQTTKAYFAGYGVSIDEGLLPYLRDANDFRFLVKHAADRLAVGGDIYARSGYASPQERFREVLSRFTELKQVELRGEPQLLQYLAPGLNQVFEAHYLPHLQRVYQRLVAGETVPRAPAAPALDAPTSPHPMTQVDAGSITPQAQAALQTLSAMGIACGR